MVDTVEISDLVRQNDLESETPKYLAWKREKIEAAIKQADAQPDDIVTLDEMLAKHGFED